MEWKNCTHCNIEKKFEKIYNKYTECKLCINGRSLKCYYENKDKLSSQRKKFYEKNRDKLIQNKTIDI